MENKGLVHIYTGDGKGKTTAAVGLLVRAVGASRKTLFCQFLKGRDTAELSPLAQLGVTIFRTDAVKKFIWNMDEDEKKICVKSHQMCYNKMKAAVMSGQYDMAVLDEVIVAAAYGLVDQADLCRLIKAKPVHTELILTGRNAVEPLLSYADYISDIRMVKHPYEKGIAARRGIEY